MPLAVALAMCGVSWIRYLLDPDGLLSFLPQKIEWLVQWLPEYIRNKILWALTQCEKCFSGQLALWSFPFLFDYNPFLHIAFILITVFFAGVINSFLNRYL
jgi:hypothetical protein